MEQLVIAIDNLTFMVGVLCLIEFLHLVFKDNSGSWRLKKIEEAIKDLKPRT